MIYAIVVPLVVVVLYLLATVRRVTIFEHERGIRYRKGRLVGVMEPGRAVIYAPWTVVQRIDIRPRFVTILGQEVLSSDGVTLRVSLAAEFMVTDPVKAIAVESYQDSLYLTLQLALRRLIGETEIEDLLSRRGEFGPMLMEGAAQAAAEVGLELRLVDVRDVMFPGELKRMFAQVVGARKEGQAAMERARGETAALRNLANAARMVEGSPALFQLRLLQQLEGSTGNTVVLGFPPGTTPLPLREGEDSLPEGEPGADED